MQPSDADTYFGKVLREAKPSTRTGRAAALTVYFQFLELRHKIELHNLTGRMIECPLDEMNRPRSSVDPQLRIPPAEAEIGQLFAGWRGELATCRKFAPAARNYATVRLEADVGLRINEARMLDLEDVRWELGRFGKLNVRHGKGSRRRGPKPRLVFPVLRPRGQASLDLALLKVNGVPSLSSGDTPIACAEVAAVPALQAQDADTYRPPHR